MRSKILSPDVAESGRPYSQAIQVGDFIFVSGQVSVDAHGAVVAVGDVRAQTAQVLENIISLLQTVGSGLADVVKVTVFMRNESDYDGMNEVFRSYFSDPWPARSTIYVGLVRDEFLVEVEAIACHNSDSAERQ